MLELPCVANALCYAALRYRKQRRGKSAAPPLRGGSLASLLGACPDFCAPLVGADIVIHVRLPDTTPPLQGLTNHVVGGPHEWAERQAGNLESL